MKDLTAISKSDVVDLRKLLIRVSKELSTVNIMYTLFGFKEYDFFIQDLLCVPAPLASRYVRVRAFCQVMFVMARFFFIFSVISVYFFNCDHTVLCEFK